MRVKNHWIVGWHLFGGKNYFFEFLPGPAAKWFSSGQKQIVQNIFEKY